MRVKTSKKTRSSSAGGVAGARGNVYQKKAAAWWLTRVLTQNTTIGAGFGLSAGVLPIRVFGQTEDPVDDVRVEFGDSFHAAMDAVSTAGVSCSVIFTRIFFNASS